MNESKQNSFAFQKGLRKQGDCIALGHSFPDLFYLAIKVNSHFISHFRNAPHQLYNDWSRPREFPSTYTSTYSQSVIQIYRRQNTRNVSGIITMSDHSDSPEPVRSLKANSLSPMEYDLAAPPLKIRLFEVMEPQVPTLDLSACGDWSKIFFFGPKEKRGGPLIDSARSCYLPDGDIRPD